MAIKPYAIGESCLCWLIKAEINAATSARVLQLYKALKLLPTRGEMGILDVVPSYGSLAVYFDPVTADVRRIEGAVQDLVNRGPDEPAQGAPSKEVTLPVRYNGPDIVRVAEHNGLSPQEVIELHAGGRYTVAMIGFLPHFPYLIGLPDRLATPRLASPRKCVPAGSVAIGGAQTGVYPRESPGGWNIIGATDPERLIPLEPGDRLVFEKL